MKMKDLFPDYFVNEDKINEIWDGCLFVFDANFLCDLYRYSDTTRLEFVNLLKQFNDRVWLPNRAVDEYLRNRRNVIKKQEALYVDVIKKLEILEGNLNHKKQHPFVSDELHSNFLNVSRDLKEELEISKAEYVKRINGEDDIRNDIVEVFDGKVGACFNNDDLEKILADGALRYENKIPPGYKDKGKEKDDYENQCLTEIEKKARGYGDLIIWRQIIKKANEDKVNVIFITSDSKEDWWKLEGPNTLGPRRELIEEFEAQTKKFFHMYSPDRFLKFAQEYLKVKVNEEALEEIKEIKKEDEKKNLEDRIKVRDARGFVNNKDGAIFENEYNGSVEDQLRAKDHIESLLSRIEKLNDRRNELLYELKALDINSEKGSNDSKNMMRQINFFDNYKNALMSKVRFLEEKIYKAEYNDMDKDYLE